MKLKFASLVFIAAITLAGCSSQVQEEGPASSPSSTSTSDSGSTDGTSETSEPAEEPSPTADPAFVYERYSQIAGRSCLKAMDEGVVEQSADGIVKLILVPKDQAHLGYSAVYIEQFGDQESDKYVELLFEVGFFSSCSDYVDMELAQEAGVEFDYVEIKEDLPNATYEVTRDFDGEQYTMRYEVINGVIASSERVIEDSIKLEITYGTTDNELALLTNAVDEYMESE